MGESGSANPALRLNFTVGLKKGDQKIFALSAGQPVFLIVGFGMSQDTGLA